MARKKTDERAPETPNPEADAAVAGDAADTGAATQRPSDGSPAEAGGQFEQPKPEPEFHPDELVDMLAPAGVCSFGCVYHGESVKISVGKDRRVQIPASLVDEFSAKGFTLVE